jgi:hypothetical protein
VDSPGFNAMTHQQGQDSGTAADDENWAGRGFALVPGPASLDPEPGQASDKAA